MKPEILDGDRVRHTRNGKIGRVDGTTTIRKYFETPDDTFVYRLRLVSGEIIPCSPAFAERVKGHSAETVNDAIAAASRRSLIDRFATNHCFSCGASIAKSIQPRCTKCGGTKCDCGECLCGFSGARY